MLHLSAQEKNRRLAKIYYDDVMNGYRLHKIPAIIGEDFTFTIPTHPEVFRGIKGFEEEVTGLHGAFPDVHLDVHHKWFFDDLILGLWTGTGTHNGAKPLSTPAGPLPATNRSFKIEGVSWISADGEMLRENLANEDTLRIIHDLGVKDCTSLYSAASASLVQSCQFPGLDSENSFINVDLLSQRVHLNHPLLNHDAHGRAQIQAFSSAYWSAFSDIRLDITHAKQSAGVNAFRWRFDAQHTGKFFGIEATGKSVHHQGVTVFILNTIGEVEEIYTNENLIVLLGQIESVG